MKRILTVLILFSGFYGFAQQEPYYTHFKYIPQAYNPAAAGEHVGYICLSGVSHLQWRGYDDVTLTRGTDAQLDAPIVENVAPETHNFNVSTMFKLDKAELNYLGLGVSIVDDNVGVTKTTSMRLNLNYKRQFQGGFRELSIGGGFGLQQFGIVNPNFKYRDPNDPNIPTVQGNLGKFNLNAGVYFKQQRLGPLKDFFAGVSATQLTAQDYVGVAGLYSRQFVRHYFALAGGDIELNGNNLILEPAVLFKYGIAKGFSFKPQVDLHATVLYANTIRGGIAYRQWANADATSVLLGYKINQKNAKGQLRPIELGYSYDITLSSVNSVSNGTHEFMVKICLPYSYEPPEQIIRLTPRFL